MTIGEREVALPVVRSNLVAAFADVVADGLADRRVRSIGMAPDGAVWFGTWQSGLSRYVPAN